MHKSPLKIQLGGGAIVGCSFNGCSGEQKKVEGADNGERDDEIWAFFF